MKRYSLESICLKDLTFSYPHGPDIFSDLTFTCPSQHPVILQGPTGGGKTTLMKILLGLLAPKSGEYLINGKKMNQLSHQEFDSYRLNMAFAFDVGGLINNRTLYENFILPMEYHNFMPASQRKDYIVSFFERFGISEQKHIRPAFVTAGTRKLASVVKSFVLNPELVILNNPTLGLNTEHMLPLVNLIQEYRQQKNLKYLIISTDDQQFVQMLGGQTYNVTPKDISLNTLNLKKVG
jgi:ABC-type transporter Mla maintaining outer membrane lipid asymmetry ATPase subunit MlaF